MRGLAFILCLGALSACGSDVPSSRSAAVSQEAAASRAQAQAGRIDNRATLACIASVTTPAERAIIADESPAGEVLLQDVVRRDEMIRCMNENNVVVYL